MKYFLILVVLLFSCKKDDNKPRIEDDLSISYRGQIWVNNVAPTNGRTEVYQLLRRTGKYYFCRSIDAVNFKDYPELTKQVVKDIDVYTTPLNKDFYLEVDGKLCTAQLSKTSTFVGESR